MRTDSLRVSEDAIQELRVKIAELYGADHLPEQPNRYKAKKNAQEAHEAIRPTSMELPPESIRKHLKDEQFKAGAKLLFVGADVQVGLNRLIRNGAIKLTSRGEDASSEALLLTEQAEEDVLGADVVVLERPRLVLCENDDLASSLGKAFEQLAFFPRGPRNVAEAPIVAKGSGASAPPPGSFIGWFAFGPEWVQCVLKRGGEALWDDV